MKIIINKDIVEEVDELIINSGSINYYKYEVEFDSSWDNLTKKAILTNNSTKEAEEIAVLGNEVSLNISENGAYSIGFVGYIIENEKKAYQISTNLKAIPLVDIGAGEIQTEEHKIPTPSEWELYIKQIEDLIDDIQRSEGTRDYEELYNLPAINDEELIGNKTTEDLGILKDVKDYIDENKEELKGEDGFSPRIEVSKTGKTTTINITDAQGTKIATINDGLDGKDGSNGTNGSDGFSPVARVEETSNGATINITDKNGTTSATIKNGKDGSNGRDGITPTIGENGNWYLGDVDTGNPSKGEDGKPGEDGYTPIKGVDYFDGKNGEDGYTPIKGTDYYTEADKEEIVNLVLEALPSSEGVEY